MFKLFCVIVKRNVDTLNCGLWSAFLNIPAHINIHLSNWKRQWLEQFWKSNCWYWSVDNVTGQGVEVPSLISNRQSDRFRGTFPPCSTNIGSSCLPLWSTECNTWFKREKIAYFTERKVFILRKAFRENSYYEGWNFNSGNHLFTTDTK